MVELAQSEVVGKLPKLLDKLDSQSVVICRDGKRIGAIVSMSLFDELKETQLARMKEISTQAGAKVAEHAAELGITSEELVERLLSNESEADQLARVEAFERSRDVMVTELAGNLARNDINFQEFITELLAS